MLKFGILSGDATKYLLWPKHFVALEIFTTVPCRTLLVQKYFQISLHPCMFEISLKMFNKSEDCEFHSKAIIFLSCISKLIWKYVLNWCLGELFNLFFNSAQLHINSNYTICRNMLCLILYYRGYISCTPKD